MELPSALRPRNPLTVVAFVVLLVVTSATYGMTAAGHHDTFRTDQVQGTVIGYDVAETEYGPVVVVQVRVENPLFRSITVGGAVLAGTVNGTTVATLGDVYQDAAVPAGQSKVVEMRLRPAQNKTEAAVRAARNGALRVSGSVRATIGEHRFSFDVSMPGEDDA